MCIRDRYCYEHGLVTITAGSYGNVIRLLMPLVIADAQMDLSLIHIYPDVNKIAFTGSASVGKIIVKEAADTVKRVTLELGGKSPNIFFADADFEAAIDGALFGVFINQGEVCSAGSRILVQKSIYKTVSYTHLRCV